MRTAYLGVACLVFGALGSGAMSGYRSFAAAKLQVAQMLDNSPDSAGVFMVFQAEDCFADTSVLRNWRELHGARQFPVMGLLVNDDSIGGEQRDQFRRAEVHMPVRAISRRMAERVGARLAYTSTPFAVVIDRRQRVVASFPARERVPASVIAALIGR